MDVTTPGKADLIASCALSEQLGGETYLYCEVEGLPQITVHRPGQLSVSEGEEVALSVDRTKLHIFDRNGLTLANGVSV
jgi:multiple sugar transport system ATP-binding protein